MMSSQSTTTIKRHDLQRDQFSTFSEIEKSFKSKHGGQFYFKETQFDSLQFIQCEYATSEREVFTIDVENEVIEMHFLLKGTNTISTSNTVVGIESGGNVLRHQCDEQQKVLLAPVQNGRFFEIRVGSGYIPKLLGEDGADLFAKHKEPMATTPEMYHILTQIHQQPYRGAMKALFMEAKMMELFLLQWQQKQQTFPINRKEYNQADKERIIEAKRLIDVRIGDFMTISELSILVGINKRKLMQGFKHYFGSTIFEYTIEVKMRHARFLLEETDQFVSEVSNAVGYKNAQHFSTAFKKYFGLSPRDLKHR